MNPASLYAWARRAPTWLRSVVTALGLVYLTYLLAANVVLRTRLLRHWLDKDESALRVDYASAWSLYPGHVVVRGLNIRFQDQNVEMSIALAQATLDIDLWKLTGRVARFENVRADGVVYHLRPKLDASDEVDRRVEAFPPIEGFADPPRRQPPSMRVGGPSWTIEVRDIQATVREVWTLEYRLRGDAHLAGGFRIAPGHYAYVTPSTMRVDNGLLSFGDHDFIRGGSWAAEVRVEPFAAGGVHGIEILRYMDIVLHQHDGTVALASLGDVYLPPGTSLEGGGGALAIDAHLDHGIVRAESRVTYQSHDVGVRSAWFAGRGDVDFVANVDEGEGGPRVVARARTEHAALTPATDLRELRGNIVFRGIDVTAPIVVTRLEGGYASAHTPDLRAWQPAADRAVVFEGGAVTSTAHAVLGEGGTLEGHIESTLDNIAMAIGPFSFVSSGTTSTRVVSDDLSKWIAFPAARVDVHDVAVRLLNGHSRGMWVRARSADTRIATSGATATDSTIDVTAGPGEQAVQLFTRLASLPDVAADVTHGTQLEAALHLRVRQGEISLGILRAHDGALDGRGRVRKRVGQAPSGAFLLSVGPVFAGLDIERGNVSIRPLATSSWLAETLAKR